MATFEEVKLAIGSLPQQVAVDIFEEFKVKIGRFASWVKRERVFRESIQTNGSFAEVLRDWEQYKSDSLIGEIADNVLLSLKDHGIAGSISQKDIKDYILSAVSH